MSKRFLGKTINVNKLFDIPTHKPKHNRQTDEHMDGHENSISPANIVCESGRVWGRVGIIRKNFNMSCAEIFTQSTKR